MSMAAFPHTHLLQNPKRLLKTQESVLPVTVKSAPMAMKPVSIRCAAAAGGTQTRDRLQWEDRLNERHGDEPQREGVPLHHPQGRSPLGHPSHPIMLFSSCKAFAALPLNLCHRADPVDYAIYVFEKKNKKKADILYNAIDASNGFYRCPVDKSVRSLMNVPFTLQKSELEAEFIKEAATEKMVQLKGHRSVGGMRASIYNAMPLAGVETLVAFMKDFQARHA